MFTTRRRAKDKSLPEKVYEIFVGTIGFLWNLYLNNRISREGVRDFLTVKHQPTLRDGTKTLALLPVYYSLFSGLPYLDKRLN